MAIGMQRFNGPLHTVQLQDRKEQHNASNQIASFIAIFDFKITVFVFWGTLLLLGKQNKKKS